MNNKYNKSIINTKININGRNNNNNKRPINTIVELCNNDEIGVGTDIANNNHE